MVGAGPMGAPNSPFVPRNRRLPGVCGGGGLTHSSSHTFLSANEHIRWVHQMVLQYLCLRILTFIHLVSGTRIQQHQQKWRGEKYWLGSAIRNLEKNLFRIPGSKRHRIPDPQHWISAKKTRQEEVYKCRGSVPLSLRGWPTCAWKISELGPKLKKKGYCWIQNLPTPQFFMVLDLAGDENRRNTYNRQNNGKFCLLHCFLVKLKIKSIFEAESWSCLK